MRVAGKYYVYLALGSLEAGMAIGYAMHGRYVDSAVAIAFAAVQYFAYLWANFRLRTAPFVAICIGSIAFGFWGLVA